jgi:hypothetical protein
MLEKDGLGGDYDYGRHKRVSAIPLRSPEIGLTHLRLRLYATSLSTCSVSIRM